MVRQSNIREVATAAGVSTGAVSSVLNNRLGHVRIAEKTRQHILDTARRLKYAPNVNAKRLFNKRSGVIALVVPSYEKMGQHIFEDDHVVRMLSGLERGLAKTHKRLLLVFNDDRFQKEKRHLSLFRERSVDAILAWGAYDEEVFWSDLAAEGYAHLFLGNVPCRCEHMNYLTHDYKEAAYLAARHLLEAGRRKLAWIAGPGNISVTRWHEVGIKRALTEAGLGRGALVVKQGGDYQSETVVRCVEELLAEKRAVSSLIVTSYGLAKVAFDVLHRHAIAVPQGMSLACCDDIQSQARRKKEITKVEMHDFDLGEEAASAIETLIQNPRQQIQKTFAVDFFPAKHSAG